MSRVQPKNVCVGGYLERETRVTSYTFLLIFASYYIHCIYFAILLYTTEKNLCNLPYTAVFHNIFYKQLQSIKYKRSFPGLYTKWDSFTPRKYTENYPHLLPHLSLLPSLFIWFLPTLPSKSLRKQLPASPNQLSSTMFSTKTVRYRYPTYPYLRLKSRIYIFYSSVNLKVICQSTGRIKLKSFFSNKDQIDCSEQFRIIYRANCWDCHGFDIGKTKRRLHDNKWK